jgi:hypothetical protein
MNRYDPLWQALALASSPSPSDLASAISKLPEVGRVPSPWVTWTLIGLVRHLRRQYWVGEIVATRFGVDSAWWIRHRMDEFHDRAMQIRQLLPDQVAGAG